MGDSQFYCGSLSLVWVRYSQFYYGSLSLDWVRLAVHFVRITVLTQGTYLFVYRLFLSVFKRWLSFT